MAYTSNAQYSILIDDEAPITYIGESIPGTTTATAEWRIKRIDETNTPDITIKYAGGGAFTQVWNDRAGLSYT